MPRQRMVEFTVSGRGCFPFDMLRYDSCWPLQESDSAVVQATISPRASRETREVRMRGLTMPTEGRWTSFGWTVTKADVAPVGSWQV